MIGDIDYQKEFNKKHGNFIGSLTNLQKLILFGEDQTKSFKNLNDKVIYYIHRQIIEDFNSIFILVGNGFSRNAMKILRSMYEHCVTLKYLNEFPDEIIRFCDYQHITKYKAFNKLKESYDGEILYEDFVYIDKNYQSVKETYTIVRCKKCDEKGLDHKWSKLDMIAIAKKVGLDKNLTYYCYINALSYSHPSAQSILDRTKENNEGETEYFFESPEDERICLKFSHLMLLISHEVLFKQFELIDQDELLKKTSEDFMKIWNDSNTELN